jgi:hypothetical protein
MAPFIGRSLAFCVHPLAAWRRGSRARAVVVAGYFVASYTMFLLALTL